MLAFDHIAAGYDQEFSWSPIGLLQRKMVWDFLEKIVEKNHSLTILELNCGTGEDALWLLKNQHKVLATDISPEMIKVAKNKAIAKGAGENIGFGVMDIMDAAKSLKGKKFDLVFSNFGGLNCLGEPEFAEWLFGQLPALLNPGGRFVAVLLSKFCAWESFYFLSKFQFSKAFRRFSRGPVEGKLSNESSVNTWYYSPRWIRNHLPDKLMVTAVKPIGVFIPPSGLNGYFSTREKMLLKLADWDERLAHLGAAALVSDHYLIEIKPKPA
jgi:ubiquinone/menaquinone biosynthesis C-methylase UbiE